MKMVRIQFGVHDKAAFVHFLDLCSPIRSCDSAGVKEKTAPSPCRRRVSFESTVLATRHSLSSVESTGLPARYSLSSVEITGLSDRHSLSSVESTGLPARRSRSTVDYPVNNPSRFAKSSIDYSIERNENDSNLEDRVEQSRARRGRPRTSGIDNSSTRPTAADIASTSETSTAAHTIAWAFGRLLQTLFGDQHIGILVLDSAERLLSLAPRRNSTERTNFFSQLLLLPKTLSLNLTVVAVTNSVLLDQSRK
jgi:hypothetical protein